MYLFFKTFLRPGKSQIVRNPILHTGGVAGSIPAAPTSFDWWKPSGGWFSVETPKGQRGRQRRPFPYPAARRPSSGAMPKSCA